MNTDALIIRPILNFTKGEDLVTVREMVLRQMKEGVIMLPFGYEVVKVSKDAEVRVTPDKDERKVIHNATTYICMAEKNGRPGEAENIAQKLYDRAYRKGYEAGKKKAEDETLDKIFGKGELSLPGCICTAEEMKNAIKMKEEKG